MNKLMFVLFLIMISSFSNAQEDIPTQIKLDKVEILNRLKALEESRLKDFLIEMQKIGKLSTEYIRQRDEECSGVYSTITTNERGEKVEQKKKLSRKEKKLCKYLLVNFQIQLAEQTFKLRKKYLKQLHQDQLQQLDDLAKKRLAELETLAGKYK